MAFAAFHIDGRPFINRELIIRDHLRYLPPDWDCLVFTPRKNSYLAGVFHPKERVKFFEIPESFAGDYWSHALSVASNAELWEILCAYERVVFFEHDSMILRKGVEEFLGWDYIGAPWPASRPWVAASGRVGNGGLSIRNPRKFLEIVKGEKPGPQEGEDLFFGRYFKKYHVNVAPVDVAEKFSCEATFKLGTFGCHAINRYMTPAQVSQILTQYGKNKVLRSRTTYCGDCSPEGEPDTI